MNTATYQSNGYRPSIESLTGMKIIDIGGANSFAHGHLDAIIDIRQPQAAANHVFIGDIDTPELWEKVHDHVKQNGKWDYAICTHTLEDINNPVYAARNISQIANAGFIAVPSKYRELSRFSGNFRGFIHHRWIFDVIDGEITAFPKINWIEDPRFDKAVKKLEGRDELVMEWHENIGMRMLNDGMPYGTAQLSGEDHIKQLYDKLLL
jgi:hypothetical protein